MRIYAAAFLFCLSSTIAHAQVGSDFIQVPKPVLCGPLETIVKGLINSDVDEKPAWMGKSDDGKSEFVLFVNSKTSAFTMVQIVKEVGCILGIGYKSILIGQSI